jgi:hypothetical protein
LDLCYVDHWSLKLDFSILAKAVVLLFRRDGVYFAESSEQGAARNGDQESEIRDHLTAKSREHRAGNGELIIKTKAAEHEASGVRG